MYIRPLAQCRLKLQKFAYTHSKNPHNNITAAGNYCRWQLLPGHVNQDVLWQGSK